MWVGKWILLLFVAGVWMPLVLYTERMAENSELFPGMMSHRGEILNVTFGKEAGRVNGVLQETSVAVKGPIGIANDGRNYGSSDKISGNSKSMEEDKEMEHHFVSTTQFKTQGNMHKKLLEKRPKLNQRADRQKATTGGHGESKTPPNARIRQLTDQLLRAKIYQGLPSTRSNSEFIRELRVRTREIEKVLGQSTTDVELPKSVHEKLKAMEQTLAKGKAIHGDCPAVVRKLRAMIETTDERLEANKKQAAFLTQLAAKTVPRGLHCLPLRLTTEFYSLDSGKQQLPYLEKIENPDLYHYALFSDNVLATAVVVNSTVFHAKDPENHVFHIVTDRINYAAMKMWFLANPPPKAVIHVQNVEEFSWLNSSYSPVLEQLGSHSMIDYYFRSHLANADGNLKFRNPKYLSILNHLRFYLPEVLPKINKVLFLDDDIVVQKDLTPLWKIDLMGNVNGAVETCQEGFHRFDRYLNFSNPLIAKMFDPNACGWAYGMNVFDLAEWRKQNLTGIYHSWQKLNQDRHLWKLGTLPPGLLTFSNRTFALPRSWHLLGLGYRPNLNREAIEKAAVLHYNGNKKPWLEISISKYREYWSKYVDYDQDFLRECNITP